MLIELPPDARGPLRPLFEGFPGLHGCVDAVLEGTMGTARADDAHYPKVALAELDFAFLAGDPDALAADEAVRSLQPPAWPALSSASWEPLLRRVWGDAVATRTRVAFQPGAWEADRLRAFMEALPSGFSLKRITIEDAVRFEALADSLVYNFPSLDAYASRGVGFGIEHAGRFVSGCSSFAISSRSLEFDIQTHPDFRRRGLATAAAAAMIEHCLDAGLEPCWDAHNEMSAALATKLGFIEPRPYTCYEIGAG
jgi:GNAT superfamily N-acetyltransferase